MDVWSHLAQRNPHHARTSGVRRRDGRDPAQGRGRHAVAARWARRIVAPLAVVAAAALVVGCTPDGRQRAQERAIAGERREGITRADHTLRGLQSAGQPLASRAGDWCDEGRRDTPWAPSRLECHVERHTLIDPRAESVPDAAALMRSALASAGCAGATLTDEELSRDVANGGGGVFTSSGCSGMDVTVRWYRDVIQARERNSATPFRATGFWVDESSFDEASLSLADTARPFLWWVGADYTYVDERR